MGTENPKFKVRKKKLGSYPYISVILSITLALFVIGIFGLLMIYSKELERIVREDVTIQVYLKNHITETQRLQIDKNLNSRYFIPKNTPEKPVVFFSKDEAAKKFINDTGEDFQKFLGENPLRDAYLVKIDPLYQNKVSMLKIKSEVEKISGVFQVDYVESLISSINENVTQIGLVLGGIASLLILTVVLLINNTLRLALFSQRFLIRSMQLVGARRWFIQRPFLIRASLHGMISGLFAAGLLIGLIYYATRWVEDLTLIQNNDNILILLGTLIILGIFVAVFSTYRAVRKYLKLSLDELY
jgi:cell division transport system permease protein